MFWTPKADIVDVFSSIQGEGIFLGARQIFVRFKRCNLECVFCDEPRNLPANEYSAPELVKEIDSLEKSKGPHHSVCLTGGEPLLYTDFLKSLLRILRKDGYKSYLETNGTLPRELAEIISLVDIIAMDFKLPSSTGQGDFWNKHLEFLKLSAKRKVFVKAVVTPSTTREDIEKAISLVKRVNKTIPFVLQPVTPAGLVTKGVAEDALFKFLEMALKQRLENVRVLPQIHKILNVK